MLLSCRFVLLERRMTHCRYPYRLKTPFIVLGKDTSFQQANHIEIFEHEK
jgi:hypothetical protein